MYTARLADPGPPAIAVLCQATNKASPLTPSLHPLLSPASFSLSNPLRRRRRPATMCGWLGPLLRQWQPAMSYARGYTPLSISRCPDQRILTSTVWDGRRELAAGVVLSLLSVN